MSWVPQFSAHRHLQRGSSNWAPRWQWPTAGCSSVLVCEAKQKSPDHSAGLRRQLFAGADATDDREQEEGGGAAEGSADPASSAGERDRSWPLGKASAQAVQAVPEGYQLACLRGLMSPLVLVCSTCVSCSIRVPDRADIPSNLLEKLECIHDFVSSHEMPEITRSNQIRVYQEGVCNKHASRAGFAAGGGSAPTGRPRSAALHAGSPLLLLLLALLQACLHLVQLCLQPARERASLNFFYSPGSSSALLSRHRSTLCVHSIHDVVSSAELGSDRLLCVYCHVCWLMATSGEPTWHCGGSTPPEWLSVYCSHPSAAASPPVTSTHSFSHTAF
jgi:hypothetical protein